MYSFCSVCNFDFNYIIHFEHIEEEEKYFVEELNASDLITPKWENQNKLNISNGQLVVKYFELLTDKEIKQLYKIYENDFHLFDYQFEFREMKFNFPKYNPGPAPAGRNDSIVLSLSVFLLLVNTFSILL